MQYTNRGFTLVEIMVTVLIVAILASIAIPSYRSYMIRAQRTDAKASLLQIQAAQEKYYLQNNRYSNDVVGELGLIGTSEHGLYTVAAAFNGSNQSYIATATPIAGKGQDSDAKCTTFTINDTGVHDSTGSATAAECWK